MEKRFFAGLYACLLSNFKKKYDDEASIAGFESDEDGEEVKQETTSVLREGVLNFGSYLLPAIADLVNYKRDRNLGVNGVNRWKFGADEDRSYVNGFSQALPISMLIRYTNSGGLRKFLGTNGSAYFYNFGIYIQSRGLKRCGNLCQCEKRVVG